MIKKAFETEDLEVDNKMYEKYIAIGFLFFEVIPPHERAMTATSLCTFYKGTNRPRWNKFFLMQGRGNGKDGLIAWWCACLTCSYHRPHVTEYDIDIIGNSLDQSYRPVEDILTMVRYKGQKEKIKKEGEFSARVLITNSLITARSSDARVQDGLRSGAVVFNEVHAYENTRRLDVMRTGLGKKKDPREFYITTNGEVRGGVLDDMLDTAKDVLNGDSKDRGRLYFIYKLDDKEEVHNKKMWVKANPSLPYMENLQQVIEDQYEDMLQNPNSFVGFMQKRMNLPEQERDREVVSWEFIKKTNQPIDYASLQGKNCYLGLDLSRTTDWTGINLLFYDEKIDKYICINHAFICANNRDLSGIKAPYMEWVEQGHAFMVNEKDVDPKIPIDYAFELAKKLGANIVKVYVDNFRKSLVSLALEKHGFSREKKNVVIVRPSNIAEYVPIIERVFLYERFVWGDNPMLRWATNNTKVIPWKAQSTGDNDMGNRLYGKINQRFRKTDPFMALVHSMIGSNELAGEQAIAADLPRIL